MKKILSALMVLLMIGSIGIAETAETDQADFSSYSNEELLQMQDEIHEELFDRGVEFETDFYFGVYRVGEDILPGKYSVVLLDDPQYEIDVYVYENEEKHKDRKSVYHGEMESQGTGCYFSITEGMIMEVETMGKGGVMKIKRIKEVWMP